MRDRGLREVAAIGGPAEVPQVGDRREGLKMAQFHDS
jgi:hypothetical protein